MDIPELLAKNTIPQVAPAAHMDINFHRVVGVLVSLASLDSFKRCETSLVLVAVSDSMCGGVVVFLVVGAGLLFFID